MAEALSQPRFAGAWPRHAVALALLLACLAAGFHATFADMVRIWWTSSTFNHGFLILPIAIFIGWQKRDVLAAMAPSVSPWGVAYVAMNSLLWVTGELMSIAFFGHAAVVGMIVGCGWALLGNRVFRVLLFPFLYLYFMVPEGEFLVPHLQDLTAAVLVKALRATGIPVFIEGRYLAIPSGNFVVAEACSGINYLIATLAVGAMFMYLNFVAWWRRLLFMLVAVAVPLVANGLRAYGIVMIAHLSDYKYAMGVDHFIYGWVFFGIVIFALFALGNLFSDVDTAPSRPVPVPGRPAPAGALGLILACLVLVTFAPPWLLARSDSARAPAPAVTLPELPGWEGPLPLTQRLGADFPGADRYLAGRYLAADGAPVDLEIVHLGEERDGHELVNSSNVLFDAVRWLQIDYGHRDAPPGSIVEDLFMLRVRDQEDGEEMLVWQWYDAHGVRSATRLRIKIAQARARLAGEPGGGAVVMIRTPLAEGARAEAVLAGFSSLPGLALDAMAAP